MIEISIYKGIPAMRRALCHGQVFAEGFTQIKHGNFNARNHNLTYSDVAEIKNIFKKIEFVAGDMSDALAFGNNHSQLLF